MIKSRKNHGHRFAVWAVVIMALFLPFSCSKPDPAQKGKATGSGAVEKCIHNADKARCFICDPSLRDSKRLWCKEHNSYEDRCFICHPELQDKSRLYCKEHSLYEDECFLCHPELASPAGKSQNAKPDAGPSQICKEHGMTEQECGICHPELLAALNAGDGLKIRFESGQSAEKAGITTALPDSAFVKGGISFPARTALNENATAVVTARYGGVITGVKVDLGTAVGKGQVLATISSPEFAQTIAEFRSTENEARLKETDYLREKDLFEKKVSSRQELDNASALYHRARNAFEVFRQQLVNAGFAPGDLSRLLEQSAVLSDFILRAPVSGTITQRSASVGQTVGPETPIVTIVDLSSLWIHASVPASMGARLAPGNAIQVAFDAGALHSAKINWVSPEVDLASGTVKIRAQLKNPKQSLKSGMFCRAFLEGQGGGRLLAIPQDALANIDGIEVVFVRLESDLYEVRRVAQEGVVDGRAMIADGLKSSDRVVVGGTFVVKSEFLKSRLGAGCTDH